MLVRIRDMVEGDVPRLARIVGENYDKHCAQMFYVDAHCAFTNYPWKPRWIVAEVAGEAIGCACWNADWCSWGVFNICWVQVDKGHQRIGIGRSLVDHILAELRPQAVMVLLSTSKPDYYRRHWGFGPLIRYSPAAIYDGSPDETLMALSLSPVVAL